MVAVLIIVGIIGFTLLYLALDTDTNKESISYKISWKDIMRNLDRYIGQKIEISGTISQIIEETKNAIHVKIGIDEPYYVVISKKIKIHGGRPLEGDYLNFKGIYLGLVSVTRVLGVKEEIPLIEYTNNGV